MRPPSTKRRSGSQPRAARWSRRWSTSATATRCVPPSTEQRNATAGSTRCSPMPASPPAPVSKSYRTARSTRWDMTLFQRAIELNLTATFMTIRFAAAQMKRRRTGSIVATASIAGLRADPLVGYGYVAAKAAVANIVRQAAVDLAPHNVRVNAIAPGPFLTNIAGGRMHREPEVAKKFASHVPLGRIAQPDEIKGLALLLASPAGSFITGAVIPIDGGASAK